MYDVIRHREAARVISATEAHARRNKRCDFSITTFPLGGLQQNIAEMLELRFIYKVLAMPFPPADSFSGEKISHQNDVN